MGQLYTSNQWWAVFIIAFIAVALMETFRPAQAPDGPVWRRWGTHALLAVVGNLGLLAYRWSSILAAVVVRDSSWNGLLHHAWIPGPAQFVLGFLLLDMVRYWQHRVYHSVEALWRVHQVHHSDEEMDVTTALRFHPVETFLSEGSFLAAVFLLAPPVGALVAVELTTLVVDLFEHGNFSIGRMRWLSAFVVTPDIHRVHHANSMAEQNSNFATIFPWWDRVFGTYQEPRGDERLGLAELPGGSRLGPWNLVTLPLRRIQENSIEPVS